MSSLSRSVLLTATSEFDGPQVEMLELVHLGNGFMYSGTWYEGTVKNHMETLHNFPLDSDDIKLTFKFAYAHSKNGELNYNTKKDYRVLMEQGKLFQTGVFVPDALPSSATHSI